MVLLKATFIDENGPQTGLSPTVNVVDTELGLLGTFNMTEIYPGNYIYDYTTYNEGRIHFFNYDSHNNNTINRYQGENDNYIKVLYQMSGGSGGTNARADDEKKKLKELVDKIVDGIKKEIPNYKDDVKNIEEKLVTIVDEIKNSSVEIDYNVIDQSIEESTKDIKNSIKGIKIPKYKEDKIIKDITKEIINTNKLVGGIDKSISNIEDCIKKTENKICKKLNLKKNKELSKEDVIEIILEKALEKHDKDIENILINESALDN